MTKITILCLIVVGLFTFGSLLAGADYLELQLPGGLPFGNILTAVGLSSTSASALLVSRQNSFLRRLSIVSLTLSTTWLPVSIFLAGNLALNFNGGYGEMWISLSLMTFALALVSMIWAFACIFSSDEIRQKSKGTT